ncbi:conserved hypothetical protein [Anaeromyxobacter sp. K]|uniref:DUF4956 domain-containing protein n=1 Tax=Anaeromyxobacter dehalogenans (strain ATCC BAA-258 / DSM 21875 / 2CP-1) TaxID=455488 RepID=B8J5C4_ANAD2|nr:MULTISPECIES: DUF4956 domain-containing protein [Anaeromyxobacter]ACG74605.1 conserved hypothetical protein [Anaeromyxobacter sp. K]ACL66786.1 conserved hypothetical protein [Anaeromyxobacter dehalogenans 2CP-1]
MHPLTPISGIDLHTLPLGTVLPRIGAALAVGVALGVRPWRLLLGRRLPKTEMAQAQILLCAAAAIITMVIGDSVAKAFGLVGLGSFVRFRSGLKDPRDAAVLFLTIGLGMACGHGTLGLALTAGLAASAVLAVLDLLPAGEAAEADAPGAAHGAPAPAGEVAPRLADASRKSQ